MPTPGKTWTKIAPRKQTAQQDQDELKAAARAKLTTLQSPIGQTRTVAPQAQTWARDYRFADPLVSNQRGMPLAQVIQNPVSQYDPRNYQRVGAVQPAYSPAARQNTPLGQLGYIDPYREGTKQFDTPQAAESRSRALLDYLLPETLLPGATDGKKGPIDPGASGYYGDDSGTSWGSGGGSKYGQAPYAWMSKLLNWNVNR
jgi:hypothetical protein